MWSEFKNPSKDRDGLYLVKLCDGAIHLGKFLNGAFVMDGFRYNETPEIIAQIIQTQPVELKVLNE